MKLYHVHRENKYDELFKKGNVIEFGEKDNFLRECYFENSGVLTTVEELEDGKQIKKYSSFPGVLKPEVFDSFSQLNQRELLEMVRDYINLTSEYNREMIVENIRKQQFPERPSREKCMFLTDEANLEYWYNKLSKETSRFEFLSNDPIKVFEVEVDEEGKLFESSIDLLPGIYDMNLNIKNNANRYWTPTEYHLNNSFPNEYLFEGKAKILNRVK